jgi:putative DNA primase/helicase
MLTGEIEVDAWLGKGEPPWGAEPIICCNNGVVRLSDGTRWDHDPRLFALNAIETEYQPEAECPKWLEFLGAQWPLDGDGNAKKQGLLQEWFGLTLTDETRFQKSLLLVGPERSGKGTIARIQRALLGAGNCCGPSLGKLATEFGMQHFPAKKLAVFPDARLDARANRSVITEKLLSVIGEDPLDINRKNRSFWSGVLRIRLMILSNELPDFKDDSGVIATRFLILQTLVSFLGREDTELEAKLRAELSGILNWAIEGWRRLADRGRFEEPGGELNEELRGLVSPVKAFVADRCELGDELSVRCETLHGAYLEWCGRSGVSMADRLPNNQFSAKLRSAFVTVRSNRRRVDNPGRKRWFLGIKVRK